MRIKEQQKNILEGWKKNKVIDIFNVASGSTPKTDKKEYWGSGYHWITPTDLAKTVKYINFTSRNITAEGFASCSTVEIPKDSLVMSSRAPIGYISINKLDKVATNQGCKSFIVKDEFKKNVNTEFFYYFLNWKIKDIQRLGAGSTFMEVSRQNLEKMPIVHPPKKEQDRIAEILAEMDKGIKKVDEVIEKTEELKKGLMQDFLTRGIGHKKFKKTKLGMIPEEWDVVEIRNIAGIKAGNGFPIKYQRNKSGRIPFYKVSDMNSDGNEKYMNVANNYLDDDIIEDIKGTIFPRGCIIYPKVGAALLGNKRRILSNESLVDNNVGVLIPNEKIVSEYLYFWMMQVDMAKLCGNGALPAVNASIVGNLVMNIPPRKEQQKIVCILNSIDDKISINKQLKEKLFQLKKGLMQDLLSGKVRV